MALTDAELMILVQQGDEDAFIEIVSRYEKRLVNFFYHLGWDYQLSEDLTQEVFIRIYRYRKRYAETARFQTFLFRIAKNLWIDQVRRRQTHPGAVSLDQETAERDERGSLKDVLADGRSPQPSDGMEREEIGRAIRTAVEGLNEQERLIFMMAVKQQLKYREIAEVLDIPEGTVKSKVFYIYRKLRDRLEELNPDEL